MERHVYQFGNIQVDVGRAHLKRSGELLHLRQKTFQVLAYLIEHRGTNVAKEQIIKDIWKDAAVVDDVLVQSIKDIRRALGDDTHHPRFIRTIPKFGYRFIGDVLPDALENTGEPAEGGSSRGDVAPKLHSGISDWTSSLRGRTVLISILLFVIIALSLGFAGRSLWDIGWAGSEVRLPQTPGRRPLVVMFFENQSQNPDLDWLREGLADMLIASFSRSPKLAVLSRGQLHSLLDRAKLDATRNIRLNDALEIARATGADALITGSFAQIGQKVRIEVQLYDANSGDMTVAETLTVEKAEQILTEIDLLSLKLANRLNRTDGGPEKAASLAEVTTDNLEAYRYYSLGVEKAQGLQNREAIKLLERATMLDPKFAMAHARIGYTYAVAWGLAEQGKPYLEKAFRLSAHLTEKDRLNISAWYAIANLDYPAAIAAFREIISLYPLETEAYWRLGRLLLGEEDYEEAVKVLRSGLISDSESKDIYNALGATYRDMGRHSDAIAMTERYVLLAPHEPNAYDSAALAYQAAGQYSEAFRAYDRALQLDPRFEVAVLHLGNLYFQTGQYTKAIRSYERYIDLAQSDWDKAWGWGRIAWVYRLKGLASKANSAAAKEIRLDKNSVASSLMLAIDLGDGEKVRAFLKRLDERPSYSERGHRPSSRWPYYLRGSAALHSGYVREALEHFRKALKHRPLAWDIDPFEDCLANAYLRLGRADEAIAEYERVLRINPNYPRARFHLAKAYLLKGRRKEARHFYRSFLETWKQSDNDIREVLAAKRFLATS